jgi:hypothetical protein
LKAPPVVRSLRRAGCEANVWFGNDLLDPFRMDTVSEIAIAL